MIIALHAAFADGPGVVVIGGTGSVAYGRNHHGEIMRAGGWGFAASDEGSGFWIGRRAVSAIMRVHDEGESTSLTAGVMAALKANSWDELILAVNASPQPDFAMMLPVVVSAAETGDTIAGEILAHAGLELANLGTVVMRRLFAEPGAVPVAMAGGVFGNSAVVRQSFYNNLRSEYPGVALNPTVIDPVRGALELARRAARR
jgi:N-acetylglucosamine kinase-like BadF-type ATPase